jgi:putative endonuclease
MSLQNIELGAWGEQQVAEYLAHKGFTILDKNWRHKLGELDLIALSPDGTVAFVEVKTRSSNRFGEPLEAITRAKETRLELLARAWRRENSDSTMRRRNFRLDYASVLGDGSNDCTIDYRVGLDQ